MCFLVYMVHPLVYRQGAQPLGWLPEEDRDVWFPSEALVLHIAVGKVLVQMVLVLLVVQMVCIVLESTDQDQVQRSLVVSADQFFVVVALGWGRGAEYRGTALTSTVIYK